MISFRGWQSVDINFFKMFRSCLFKRFLIKTGNEIKRRLWHRSKKFCITVRSKGAVMLRDLKLANSVPPWYSRLEPKLF